MNIQYVIYSDSFIRNNKLTFPSLGKRDDNGKVIIEPKNMSIKAPLEGKSKSSYFSMMGFATIGDPYIEAEKLKR